MTGNTIEGLAQLGQLVREARGKKSYRRFAIEAGLSEATIKVARLARMEVSMTDTVQGGLSINVQLMSNSQLGAVLKTIGDRLQRE